MLFDVFRNHWFRTWGVKFAGLHFRHRECVLSNTRDVEVSLPGNSVAVNGPSQIGSDDGGEVGLPWVGIVVVVSRFNVASEASEDFDLAIFPELDISDVVLVCHCCN